MNSFQRKSLYAALAGAGALGVAATANAVAINPNGLGQVLIYPYYTVNADGAGNAYNSLLSVVNTSSSAKAVKVRFLEGRNSREVLDFNLFLSRFDVWTAAIIPTSAGGAQVITADKSCTIPVNTTLQAGVPFDNDTASGGTVFNSDGTIRRQKNFSFGSDDSIFWASWEGPECRNAATGAAITCLPADAVSAVLMHNQVINEYVLDPGTKSGTDWVITFPTKRFYVNTGTRSAIKLFQRNFNKTAFSCDDVNINIF